MKCYGLILVLTLAFGFFFPGNFVFSQEIQSPPRASREIMGEILEIKSEFADSIHKHAVFTVLGEDGVEYEVDTRSSYLEGLRYRIKPKDRVILQILLQDDGREIAHLADMVRTRGLLFAVLVFSVLALVVGRGRGILALIGLSATVLILYFYVFPSLLSGGDPLIVALLGSLMILSINMPVTHGLNRITAAALAGTLGGLAAAVFLSKAFMLLTKLSGLGGDEAVYLFWQQPQINPEGLLLAAIILGAAGIFDDVAVAQAQTVAELRQANPNLSERELYTRAMRIGRHHLSSMVNTLALAYAAAALPLFLLSVSADLPLPLFLNTEAISEEIVRTLAGTSALILTVPLSTRLAVILAVKNREPAFDKQ